MKKYFNLITEAYLIVSAMIFMIAGTLIISASLWGLFVIHTKITIMGLLMNGLFMNGLAFVFLSVVFDREKTLYSGEYIHLFYQW